MEERTLLFKLLSLKGEISPSTPLKHTAFSAWLQKHGIGLDVPLLESLINISSHFEAKTQTLWIYPHLFFEGVIQALSGKRSYKSEAGFWEQYFSGEDSVDWQRFARSFLKGFCDLYDPEEVKRVLLVLRTCAECRKPMTVEFEEFMRFTKTCSLAPVRPSLPPKTRHLSVTKLQYAKLLFYTLETSVHRSFFRCLISRLPPTSDRARPKLSVKAYRKYQDEKSLRNPAHVLELTEKLESLRAVTERRCEKPAPMSARVDAARGKVLAKSLDRIARTVRLSSMSAAVDRLRAVVLQRRETLCKGLRHCAHIAKRRDGKSALKRFHQWRVAVASWSRAFTTLNISHISKDAAGSSSRECVLNVSTWFVASQLGTILEKAYIRRVSNCFQPLKSAHLNRAARLQKVLRVYRKRALLRGLLKWSTTTRELHTLSRLRKKCGESVLQLQGRWRLGAFLEKLKAVCKRAGLKRIVRAWNRWRKVRKDANFHTPSKQRKSPHRSPSVRSPCKSPRRSESSSSSPKPRKALHAPRKKKDRSRSPSPAHVDSLKVSIIRIRLQHACEKIASVRKRLCAPGLTVESAFSLWGQKAKESPRFVDDFGEMSSVTHIHNLSFSADEGLFEDAKTQQGVRAVSIAELRAAIATLRKTANAK